jgi:hypothetical protein
MTKAKILGYTTEILEDLYGTGVYSIVNKINNKFYIGSASGTHEKSWNGGFYVRFKKHLCDLNKGKHHCKYLQRSWIKYGAANFEFKILEFVAPDLCIETEQTYLDLTNNEFLYNSCEVAGSPLGFRHTKDQRAKHSRTNQTYIFNELISPVGESFGYEYIINTYGSLAEFARTKELDPRDINAIIACKNFAIKGWTTSFENYEKYLKAKDLRGLYWCESEKRWRLSLRINRKQTIIGKYNDLALAKFARDLAEVVWDFEYTVRLRK